MLPHIKPVKYISIDVNEKTYYRVARVISVCDGGNSDIKVNKFFEKRLNEENEFARLKFGEYYMDIKIKSFKLIGEEIVISFGEIIDYNNLSNNAYKKKPKNNDNKNKRGSYWRG